MSQSPSSLMWNVPIVRIKDGRPTEEFLRLFNQQINANVSFVTLQTDLDAAEARITVNEGDIADIQDVDVVAGTGLSGGGNITGPTDVTIDLEDTAVTPGTYGDATKVAQVTVDQQGRLTGVTEVNISGGAGGGGLWTPEASYSVDPSSPVSFIDIPLPDSEIVLIVIPNILPTVDNADLQLRVSTTNFDSLDPVEAGASDYAWGLLGKSSNSGSSTQSNNGADSEIRISNSTGNVSGEYASLQVEIYNSNSSTLYTGVSSKGTHIYTNPASNLTHYSGVYNAATVVNGIRLFYDTSSNISQATIYVYSLSTPA